MLTSSIIFHSKAPLRIGLAGGGTDLSPYCDLYGGAVINAAISLSAYASLEPIPENKIIFEATDRDEKEEYGLADELPLTGSLDLLKGVYNRIRRDHQFPVQGFKLSCAADAPAGSGLGTSSTLTVAVLGVFREMLELKLSGYEVARYAYDIERNDLKLPGGRQDQYAAVFGGMNFMEFNEKEDVKVHPLQLQPAVMEELESKLLLYFTSVPRNSEAIINEQVRNVYARDETSLQAMHQLKEQAMMMRDALLNGEPDDIGSLLDYGFSQKKKMAHDISNERIEGIYDAAKKAGATGGKISGAGGGGFMIFYCPGNTRETVGSALNSFGGKIVPYSFTEKGLETWREVPRS